MSRNKLEGGSWISMKELGRDGWISMKIEGTGKGIFGWVWRNLRDKYEGTGKGWMNIRELGGFSWMSMNVYLDETHFGHILTAHNWVGWLLIPGLSRLVGRRLVQLWVDRNLQEPVEQQVPRRGAGTSSCGDAPGSAHAPASACSSSPEPLWKRRHS